MHNPLPTRLSSHPRAGWISFLLFQLIIATFILLILISFGNLLPSVLPNTPQGQSKALRLAIYLSLPIAACGTVFGLAALVQATHRQLLGVVGTALNGAHLLLCLILLSR